MDLIEYYTNEITEILTKHSVMNVRDIKHVHDRTKIECYREFLRKLSEQVEKSETSKENLTISDVKHRFYPNDVDGAYLLGVFNVSGIDGLQKEIKRLKELKVHPNQIIDSIKSNGA